MLIASELRGQVKEYFITCDPDDFAYIYENFEQDIYIPITITHEGTTWTDVKMRIRGDGSRYLPKKSLKVKFFDTPFSNGRDELNFNAEYEDKSYIRATLSSMIFNMSGQKCFTTEHARLYLNGEFLGLYNRTENMDEFFLEAHGLDSDGNLYKASRDGSCLNIYDDVVNFWEQKTGSGNKEDLIQLIAGLDQVSVEDFPELIGETMDYDQAVNIIACNMVTCNQSTYYHNYYMYRDANGSGRWEMMPWDLDKTLSVYSWRNHTCSSANWTSDNPFLEKAILNPVMLADIKSRANQIFSEVFRMDIFWPKIDSLVQVLQSSVAQDTTDDIQSLDEWLAKVQIEKNHFATFPDKLNWYFDNVQSSFTCVPTPGIQPDDVTFRWTPSVDPNGLPVTYQLLLTSGTMFEPGLTQVFAGIQDTFLVVQDIPEGDYFWKVISIGAGEQEVEAYDSRNPLKIKTLQTLPCSITENLILEEADSPFLVNCDVEILPGALLTINAGVEIIFSDAHSIRVYGGIEAIGEKNNPVIFRPADGVAFWDSISMINPTNNCRFKYVDLINGRLFGKNAQISVENSYQFNSKNFHFTEALIYTEGGNIQVHRSRFVSNNTGEGLIFSMPLAPVVTESYFYKTPDAIEFLHCSGGIVSNNMIINPADDGIDFDNVHSSVIEWNTIYKALDCGITLDDCTGIIIKNNLVSGSTYGINLKNDSYALISNNTLDQNYNTIWLYEKNAGSGGGHATIENTILSNSLVKVFEVDQLSDYTVNFSLCNTESLAGNGNVMADPQYVAPVDSVFLLQPGSPCIDSGNPETPPDPDGTRSDMGAFFFNQGSYNVIFNEINYKSASDYDVGDWVELYNADEIQANISGWVFKDENDDHIFKIPFGVVLQPGDYLVISNNLSLFRSKHQSVENVIGSFDFGLGSGGELIRLFNNTNELIDHLTFGSSPPWPVEPNGSGATLELKNPLYDNTLPESWCASQNYGTPGAVNSCNVFAVTEKPEMPLHVSVFPNPSAGAAFVRLNHISGGELMIRGFDGGGKQIFTKEIALAGAGELFAQLPQITGKGIYLVMFTVFDQKQTHSQSVKLVVE